MDYVSSMEFILPDLIQHDELLFSSCFPCEDPTYNLLITSDDNTNTNSNRRREASSAFGGDGEQNSDDRKTKKMKHREIERQRRQELSTLLKTLRSFLPLEYIKGKRSASDHVHEAVNYIKDLQNKIQELSDKRDALQILSDLEHKVSGGCSSSCSCLKDNVVVMPCLAGVEIVISTCFRHGFCLSKVLRVLTEEGLNVASCTSTKMRGRFVNTIVSEVNDVRRINFFELQEKIEKTKM